MNRRIQRLNSLLKQVISDVIRKEVKNPHLPQLITVTHVDVTRDLRYAKVYVSIIGNATIRQEAMRALESASGFIGVQASKDITIRYFPKLTFILDDTIDKQEKIEEIIHRIEKERHGRE